MLSLKQRLLSVEDDFLSALIVGGDALADFEGRWQILVDDVDSATTVGPDPELLALAHATSIRLATLADTSIELFESYNDITSQLVDQVEGLMSQLTLVDCPLPSHPHSSPPPIFQLCDKPDHAPTEVAISRKRSRATSECVDTRDTPRNKRQRSLPVSSRTSVDLTKSTPPALAHSTPSGGVSTITLPSRKRRLSETDSSTSPCSKRMYTGPRLHAVSDSYATLKSRDRPVTLAQSPSQQHCPPAGEADALAWYSTPAITLDEGIPGMSFQLSDSQSATGGLPCESNSVSSLLPGLDDIDHLLQSLLDPDLPLIQSSRGCQEAISAGFDMFVPFEDLVETSISLSSPSSSSSTPSLPATPPLGSTSDNCSLLNHDDVFHLDPHPWIETRTWEYDPCAHKPSHTENIKPSARDLTCTDIDWYSLFDMESLPSSAPLPFPCGSSGGGDVTGNVPVPT